jgi:hypothetical protein
MRIFQGFDLPVHVELILLAGPVLVLNPEKKWCYDRYEHRHVGATVSSYEVADTHLTPENEMKIYVTVYIYHLRFHV